MRELMSSSSLQLASYSRWLGASSSRWLGASCSRWLDASYSKWLDASCMRCEPPGKWIRHQTWTGVGVRAWHWTAKPIDSFAPASESIFGSLQVKETRNFIECVLRLFTIACVGRRKLNRNFKTLRQIFFRRSKGPGADQLGSWVWSHFFEGMTN